jgi:ceramide glucosyltransferase
MGSTIALRREVLAEIGGFAALADVLADDYELGRAVRARGLSVALPSFAVGHDCVEASLWDLIEHEVRWAVTVRTLDPAGYAGSLITHALPLGLIGAALVGGGAVGVLVVLSGLASRMFLKWRIDRAIGRSSGPWSWLIPRDLLSFGVFVGSFFARAVYWRGARFGVSSGRKFFPA